MDNIKINTTRENINYRYIMTNSASKNYFGKIENRPSETPKENLTKLKIASGIGTLAGILTSITLISRHSTKITGNRVGMFNIKFSPKSILGVGAGSVSGGLLAGQIFGDKKNTKARLKESLLQFVGNIVTPLILLAGGMKLVDKYNLSNLFIKNMTNTKSFKYNVLKALPDAILSATSVIVGVVAGNKISTKINDYIFKEKTDRPVQLKDFGVHADDLLTMAVAVDRTGYLRPVISKCLPFTYSISGYQAGIAGTQKK